MSKSPERVCSVITCNRPYFAKDWCEAHYARVRLHGHPQADKPLRGSNDGPCKIDNCEKPSRARGWCTTHWRRWKTHGDPLAKFEKITPDRVLVRGRRRPPETASIGDRFGMWKVTGPFVRQADGQARFPCECECGTKRNVLWRGMREHGSCGCRQRERAREAHTTHGYNLEGMPRRARWVWANYGIAWEDYLKMIEDQGGRCAICPAEISPDDKSTHVDHDHACCSGQKSCGACVRGILCQNCNLMIGYAKDNPENLINAAFYLHKSDLLAVVDD